jgi:hypothetical protein
MDLGPAVAVALAHGRGSARAAVEWRFRVAGDANPGSGPALVVTTGF